MFVIYNPTGVAVATGSSDCMSGGENDSLTWDDTAHSDVGKRKEMEEQGLWRP